jgi:hypothetical protein
MNILPLVAEYAVLTFIFPLPILPPPETTLTFPPVSKLDIPALRAICPPDPLPLEPTDTNTEPATEFTDCPDPRDIDPVAL